MTKEKNITFSFRKKFEKLLNDENRRNIDSVFQKFCRLEPDEASEFLWRLTSSDEEYRSKLLEKFGMCQGMIPSESFPTFKNELRHQYEKLYPNALTAVVPECCQKAFDVLSGATDSVVATVVYQHCQQYDGDAERVMYLLHSDLERFYKGGIFELGFNSFEVEYLVPFRMKIHDLLKAVYDYWQENDDGCDNGNLPFADLGNLIQAAGLKLVDNEQEAEVNEEMLEEHQHQEEETAATTPTEEPIQVSSGFTPFTSEKVLEFREVFKHFVSSGDANVLVLISSIGFDLNEVIAKKEEISDLIQAHENMAEAQQNWKEAKESLEEAQSNLAKATQMFDGKEIDLQEAVE